MDIDVFPKHELPLVIRVLRTALRPQGALEPRERLFLDTYARITGHAIAAAELEPISAAGVQIEGVHQRKRLLQLSAIAVLLSVPVQPQSVAFLKALSARLGTRDPVTDLVQAVQEGKHVKARLIAMRRTMRSMLKEAYAAEGARGVLRFLGAIFFGAQVNKDKHWSYKRLGLLPEGTLGREYWKHLTQVGFGFPGEPGGIPDSVAYHDVAHVLADNDTTPLGEIQQGSFQAGNRREDGFFFVQFVLLQFHHGIKVTPVAPPATGNFHPDKVLWAIHRGARCTVDLTHQWNFWPLMALPLAQARAQLGLLPK